MNREDVIRMAREAGWLSEYDSPTGFCAEAAFKFAALVTAAEREACAKVCEEMDWCYDDRAEYAAAIRARGEK